MEEVLERQKRLMKLLDGALERSADDRRAFVEQQCGDDDDLRDEAWRLLESSTTRDALPASPLFDVHREAPPPLEKKSIGPYRVQRLLQRGGMGAVYLADREDFKKQVALKVIRRGLDLDHALVRRFHNERQILARLEHPHIARLHDGGTTEDQLPFFVMEYVDGEPIDLHVRRHNLDVEAILRLFLNVCAAVDFAHRNLVVHRDLKPGNILIDAHGEPKLLDFGIAKLLDQADPEGFTRSGESMMTPRYAAPEQIRHEPITTAVDVYALGVLLYELLTGVGPYRVKSDRGDELAGAICDQPAETPSRAAQRSGGLGPQRGRRLRGDLNKILLKALAKAPDERYGSPRDLAQDIERHLKGLPISASTDSWTYRGAKFIKRYFWSVLALVLLITLLAASALYSNSQRRLAERKTAEANEQRALAELRAEEADIERERAEDERTIRRLMAALLREASPNRAGNAKMTARDLIQLGPGLVETLAEGSIERQEMHNELGLLLREMGFPTEARESFRIALGLALEEPARGRSHDKTLTFWANLASVDFGDGEYAMAEQALSSILRIREQRGDSVRRKLPTWGGLANAQMMQGHFDQALELARRVHDETDRIYGSSEERQWRVGAAKNSLAMTYFVAQRTSEALDMALQAETLWRELPGSDQKLRRATNWDLLGRLYMERNEPEKARAYLERAFKTRDEAGAGLSSIGRSKQHLAELELVEGNLREAERLVQEAVESFRNGQAPAWMLQEALSVQGEVWARQGRRDAPVEARLREAAVELKRIRGAESRPAVRAMERWRNVSTAGKE